jgi:uncharacterized phage protein (TIGR01671 family)
MREIKFRLFIPRTSEMLSWSDIKEKFNIGYVFDNFLAELMQYTGIKDKNGKDIYEGDVVVYTDMSGSGRKRNFGPRVIKWQKNTCDFNLSECTEDGEEEEVIGNIYENPELLQKEV